MKPVAVTVILMLAMTARGLGPMSPPPSLARQFAPLPAFSASPTPTSPFAVFTVAPLPTTSPTPKPTSPFAVFTQRPDPTFDPDLIACYNCHFTDVKCATEKALANETVPPTRCAGPNEMNCLNVPLPTKEMDYLQMIHVKIAWSRMKFIRPKKCPPHHVKTIDGMNCYECYPFDMPCIFDKVKERDVAPPCPYSLTAAVPKRCIQVAQGNVYDSGLMWWNEKFVTPQCD